MTPPKKKTEAEKPAEDTSTTTKKGPISPPDMSEELISFITAIDDYKRLSDQGQIPITLGGEGYPEELEILVEGVELVGGQQIKRRFLRRIPRDPMTGEQEWGKRSYQDDADSTSWGGENVYDVFSLSDGTAIDGTKYVDW